jgi:NADH:ubiquinone oxidoreductase subunit 4 (subunit M)
MIIAAIYLLYMTGRVVFGKLVEPAGHEHHGPLPVDLNGREISMLTVLATLCLVLGLFPRVILDPIEPVIAQALPDTSGAFVEQEPRDVEAQLHAQALPLTPARIPIEKVIQFIPEVRP